MKKEVIISAVMLAVGSGGTMYLQGPEGHFHEVSPECLKDSVCLADKIKDLEAKQPRPSNWKPVDPQGLKNQELVCVPQAEYDGLVMDIRNTRAEIKELKARKP